MTDESSSSISSSSIRTEPMYVLYGSQTGNSEQAALDFCEQIKEKFTPAHFENLGLKPVKITTTCIQLDDFLEYKHSDFTKTVIIFVSSYGVGQAPIGSYKFRSFADELIAQAESGKLGNLLKGISYGVCGLGEWQQMLLMLVWIAFVLTMFHKGFVFFSHHLCFFRSRWKTMNKTKTNDDVSILYHQSFR